MKRQATSSCDDDDALTCPVCLDVAVPPATLAPCAHVVCYECMVTLRERETRVQPAASYGFRCPKCRRRVDSHVIVDEVRRRALQLAPDTIRGVAKAVVDAEAMRRHEAAMPAASGPTPGDLVAAHIDDDDDVAANAATTTGFGIVHMPPIRFSDVHVAILGNANVGNDVRDRVRRALVAAGLVFNGGTTSTGGGGGGAEFIERTVNLMEARVPEDLRAWQREGSPPERIRYTYEYHRLQPPPQICEAFVERMRSRGVAAERTDFGYRLTLPLENEQQFASGRDAAAAAL